MASRRAKKPAATEDTPAVPVAEAPSAARDRPLVFISHDSRDADIAEAFGNLLTDASGGVLRSFRSSDRRGTTGIEFGTEWYGAIMERLGDANDVVALLTPHSINRPWILYEAGVAKGKLDTIVFGVAVGVPLDKASIGPFAQFQNSGDDEDSLTKLVLQLIRRNPHADPREEAVRRQVVAFRESTDGILKKRPKSGVDSPGQEVDPSAVAKLFEEVKVMVRQLPEQVEGALEGSRRSVDRRSRHLEPAFVDHLMYGTRNRHPREQMAAWLLVASAIREDLPWLYDLLFELYRAGVRNDRQAAEQIAMSLREQMHSKDFHYIIHRSVGRGSRHLTDMLFSMLPEYLAHFVGSVEGSRASRRVGSSAKRAKQPRS